MHQKSSFLSLLLFVNTLVIHAQFSRGDRMVGASVASLFYNSGNSDISVASIGNNISKVTGYGVSIAPSIGWFISEKTAVGAILNINPTGNKTTYEQNGSTYQSDKSNSFNIGAGGFVRNYFSGKSNWMPFGQFTLNAGITSMKTDGFYYYSPGAPFYKYTYTGNSSGGFFANASFSAGLTRMMGENAGLDLFVGYNYSYNKNTFKRTTLYYLTNTDTNPTSGKNETTTKFTNNGFQLGLGFQVFLRGNKK